MKCSWHGGTGIQIWISVTVYSVHHVLKEFTDFGREQLEVSNQYSGVYS